MKSVLPLAWQFKPNWAKDRDEHPTKSRECRRAFASNASEIHP
jgi:hypothetical protein